MVESGRGRGSRRRGSGSSVGDPNCRKSIRKCIPSGRVTVEDLPATAANRPEITRRAQAEYQLGLRKLRLEQVAEPGIGPSQWLIAQDGSRLIGRDGAGQDIFRFNAARRSALRRFGGNSDLVQAAQLGDLLFVTLGGQVVAIDTRERGENDKSDIVWQSNQTSRFPAGARANRAAMLRPSTTPGRSAAGCLAPPADSWPRSVRSLPTGLSSKTSNSFAVPIR